MWSHFLSIPAPQTSYTPITIIWLIFWTGHLWKGNFQFSNVNCGGVTPGQTCHPTVQLISGMMLFKICCHHTCLSCAPLLAQGWLRSEVKWKWSLATGCWQTRKSPDWVATVEAWWDWDCYTQSVRGSLDLGGEQQRGTEWECVQSRMTSHIKNPLYCQQGFRY